MIFFHLCTNYLPWFVSVTRSKLVLQLHEVRDGVEQTLPLTLACQSQLSYSRESSQTNVVVVAVAAGSL